MMARRAAGPETMRRCPPAGGREPRMSLVFTHTGVPTLTLPAELSPAGLPLGVQMVARKNRDMYLLVAGAQIEKVLAFDTLPRSVSRDHPFSRAFPSEGLAPDERTGSGEAEGEDILRKIQHAKDALKKQPNSREGGPHACK